MMQSELKLQTGATAGSGRSGAGPAPEQRLPIGGRAPPLGLACTSSKRYAPRRGPRNTADQCVISGIAPQA